MRIGFGYDIHALKKGRKLVLGGVHVPFARGLEGHSDGDALLHAVVDAVLGALGEGDIGEHFPNTDKRWRGADSRVFAAEVRRLLAARKMTLSHIDTVVLAEEPKLGPYKKSMKAGVAAAFGVPAASVNIKAKTNEGFGAVGKRRAIACYAVVSVTAKGKGRAR